MEPDASSRASGRRLVGVLRLPGVPAFVVTGAIARLPQSMVGLGSLLLVTGLGRSYTLGGIVSGATSLSQAFAGPFVSRLVDRRGQSRVLWPQLAVHATCLALLIVASLADGYAVLLIALGAGVGASLPQVGALTRARWTALLRGDQRLDEGLAIEALVDEAIFVVGPFAVTLLATAVAPEAGLTVTLALAVVGCSLFLAQRRSEPPVTRRPSGETTQSAISSSGLRVLVGSFFALGAYFGLIEVGVIALAQRHGHPSSAGSMLALWAFASVTGGIAYGNVAWRRPTRTLFGDSLVVMASGAFLVALLSFSLVTATVALIVCGAANAPAFIAGNALVRGVVDESVVTEAYTWVYVIVFAGASVGTPAGGALVDHVGPVASLWAAALPGCAAVLVAVAGRRRLA